MSDRTHDLGGGVDSVFHPRNSLTETAHLHAKTKRVDMPFDLCLVILGSDRRRSVPALCLQRLFSPAFVGLISEIIAI